MAFATVLMDGSGPVEGAPVIAYLRSRNRLLALGALLALSFAAAGRNVAQEEGASWPKEINSAGSKITLFEPQLEALKGTRMSTRAAISFVPAGTTEPVYGAIWLDSTLDTSADGKTARAGEVKIVELRLPASDGTGLNGLREAVEQEISRWNLTYSMDALLGELRQLEQRKAEAQALKAEVPEINFRSHPAVMVTIDGDPEWRAIPNSSLKRIANSSFFIVEEANAGKCYLRIEPFWWNAASALGPWQAAEAVPDDVEALWKNEPRPAVADDDDREEIAKRPEVLTSTRPAELIWTDGLPQYAAIAGTDLLYVKNTSSDVFLEISTQMSYVLLSGRWFRTISTRVAWEFVPADKLPLDFGRVPVGSEKQHVLACVAGTPQAREALKNAEIPQTEAVKRGPAPDLRATYDGEPQFAEISDSPVRYAVNSPSPIFSCDRRYYWCEDGIWYDSDYAVGPWAVCSDVPRPIYLIPPSCPFYYVTFCRIFSVSPYSVCYGYYPGYRGCYVWGPTIVYGTGWRYRWWVGSSCYVRPVTWGVGVRWSSSACSWTFGLGWGSSCAWGGVSTYRRAPSVVVGVGGGVNVRSVGAYRNSVGVDVAVSTRQSRPETLYVRQPTRIVRPVPPVQDPPQNPYRRPTVKDPGRRDPPTAPAPVRPDGGPSRGREALRPSEPDRDNPPRVPRRDPDALRPHDPDRDATPRVPRRDDRKEPDVDPKQPRDVQRPKDPDRVPHDSNRDDDNRAPRRVDREPSKPPPAPPAPPVERRDPPRTPPPVERREPPVERREPPRNPPPPPPPVERRDPPRSPPPAEHREPPRNPPPQQEHRRDSDRSSDRGSDRRK